MKKIILTLISVLLCSTIVATAATFNEPFFDMNSNQITVGGSLGETLNGKTITVCVKKGGVIEHINIIPVDATGEYTYTFGFNGETGSYTFSATDEQGNQLVDAADNTRDFYDVSTVDAFAMNIGNGTITSDSDIVSGVMTYKSVLNVDTGYFSDSRNQTILLAEILTNKTALVTGKSAKLIELIATADAKCKALDKIENSSTWYEVETNIINNSTLLGISLTAYNNVADKSLVCTPLAGFRAESVTAFQNEFNTLVSQNQPSIDEGLIGGGSSFGGSLGGANNYPSVKPPANNADNVPSVLATVFSDVLKSHWAAEAIIYLADNKVVSGKGNGMFAPDDIVTRGEAAKMIAVAFGFENSNAVSQFADVSPASWQYPYVSALYEKKMVNGIGNDSFGVNDAVSRQDLSVILYRALCAVGASDEKVKDDFADFGTVADYAKEAVSHMAGMGIINGTDNNRFEPESSATRAQAAKLIYEILKVLK